MSFYKHLSAFHFAPDGESLETSDKRAIYASTLSIRRIAILGFDYLIDNLASNEEIFTSFNYAIIDEVDSRFY